MVVAYPSHIREAYSRYGLYVFQSVLESRELDDLHQDIEFILSRAPSFHGSELNKF
jgi:hypothetical protein